ncbi:MAG: DUF4190 domain-containing protein [Anaerolineales bacterium]|nr:DUF4190 domain-containing protein [Anaerolineales bacterium]
METKEENSHSAINAHSTLSLVFGILTLLFLCLSTFPFPFTTIICFPLSFLFGILALVFGIISLNRIRQRNESGRPMAWIGIMAGGFILLCVICMVITIGSLFIFSPNLIQAAPFLHSFDI